jgi:filamentous hemagglutinin
MERHLESLYGQENINSRTLPGENAKNVSIAGKKHPKTGVVFDNKGLPIFDDFAKCEIKIPANKAKIENADLHKRAATRELRKLIEDGKIDSNIFTKHQMKYMCWERKYS